MRAQNRKVAVACALLNQTSQPNREPTHPGLPQSSHAWTPENWRPPARHRQHPHPPSPPPEKRGTTEQRRCCTSPCTSNGVHKFNSFLAPSAACFWGHNHHSTAVSRNEFVVFSLFVSARSMQDCSVGLRCSPASRALSCQRASKGDVNRQLCAVEQWKSAVQATLLSTSHPLRRQPRSCHAVSCCNERNPLPHDTRELNYVRGPLHASGGALISDKHHEPSFTTCVGEIQVRGVFSPFTTCVGSYQVVPQRNSGWEGAPCKTSLEPGPECERKCATWSSGHGRANNTVSLKLCSGGEDA